MWLAVSAIVESLLARHFTRSSLATTPPAGIGAYVRVASTACLAHTCRDWPIDGHLGRVIRTRRWVFGVWLPAVGGRLRLDGTCQIRRRHTFSAMLAQSPSFEQPCQPQNIIFTYEATAWQFRCKQSPGNCNCCDPWCQMLSAGLAAEPWKSPRESISDICRPPTDPRCAVYLRCWWRGVADRFEPYLYSLSMMQRW